MDLYEAARIAPAVIHIVKFEVKTNPGFATAGFSVPKPHFVPGYGSA
jgi:hypothetical protein